VCGDKIDISLLDAVAMLADAADATEAEIKIQDQRKYIDI